LTRLAASQAKVSGEFGEPCGPVNASCAAPDRRPGVGRAVEMLERANRRGVLD
jgi:hypothetical protein